MKVLVAVKRVVDFHTRVRVQPDGKGLDLSAVKMALNPFCAIALEEALRLREKGAAKEVVVATLGPKASQDALRTCLAMGADRAVRIDVSGSGAETGVGQAPRVTSRNAAKALAALAAKEKPSLVLLGKQAVDDDAGAVGQMLAGTLGWGQATAASRIAEATPQGEGPGAIEVTREVDGGAQTVSLPLPAIVTADLRLNTPRFATLPNIMKAKKKKIEEIAAADLGLDLGGGAQVVALGEPPARETGVTVSSVEEFIQALKDRKVL